MGACSSEAAMKAQSAGMNCAGMSLTEDQLKQALQDLNDRINKHALTLGGDELSDFFAEGIAEFAVGQAFDITLKNSSGPQARAEMILYLLTARPDDMDARGVEAWVARDDWSVEKMTTIDDSLMLKGVLGDALVVHPQTGELLRGSIFNGLINDKPRQFNTESRDEGGKTITVYEPIYEKLRRIEPRP